MYLKRSARASQDSVTNIIALSCCDRLFVDFLTSGADSSDDMPTWSKCCVVLACGVALANGRSAPVQTTLGQTATFKETGGSAGVDNDGKSFAISEASQRFLLQTRTPHV